MIGPNAPPDVNPTLIMEDIVTADRPGVIPLYIDSFTNIEFMGTRQVPAPNPIKYNPRNAMKIFVDLVVPCKKKNNERGPSKLVEGAMTQ